jgi:hypothetical protein
MLEHIRANPCNSNKTYTLVKVIPIFEQITAARTPAHGIAVTCLIRNKVEEKCLPVACKHL